MLKVILAKSFKGASSVVTQSDKEWVAIETEYGNRTLDNSLDGVALSMNHHGKLQHEDAPALVYKKHQNMHFDNFVISHIDLDVLFGILWSAGWLKPTPVTAKLSEYIAEADINGFHLVYKKLRNIENPIIHRFFTIGYLVNSWIVNDNGKDVKDVSKEIHKLLLRIKDIILQGTKKEQVVQYKEWFKQQENTAKQHLIKI